MKKVLIILLFIFGSFGYSQKISDSVFVKSQNLYRELTVSIPPSYKIDPKRTYPLLFLLDGDYLFDPFEGAIKYGYYWDDLPELIIVGLSQDKERDADCALDEASGLPEGSGADFFEFIGGELIPYLQKKYRISPFKIIAGHDVTASFLNLYLYKDAPLFNAYISLSPELGLEMETRIPERLAGFKQNIFYYQSSSDGDIKKMKEKITTLDTNIKAVVNPSLNYKYDDFKEASHYSLVLYSIPSALYHFFSTYQPISTTEFQEKIVKLESGYVNYLKNKYDILEKTLSIKLNIRINDFKAIEAAILKNKAYPELEQLAQLSRKMYPKTMLGDYQMALFYEYTGDLKNAARYYLNAFQLQPVGSLTKDMMLDKATELKAQLKK